jgi:hypothetical protein
MQPKDTVDQLEGCVRLAFVVSFFFFSFLFFFFIFIFLNSFYYFFVTKRHMTGLEHNTLSITADDSKPQ